MKGLIKMIFIAVLVLLAAYLIYLLIQVEGSAVTSDARLV